MISARGWGKTLTDILLKGAEININFQESVRKWHPDYQQNLDSFIIFGFVLQRQGWSALFFCAESGNVATAQSLLKAGAHAHLKDKVAV